jgi:hypothetical protein
MEFLRLKRERARLTDHTLHGDMERFHFFVLMATLDVSTHNRLIPPGVILQ